MKEKILITGISGFIGQYLTKHFLDKGYVVHGMYEHEESKAKNPEIPEKNKHMANLKDAASLEKVIKEVQPHYVFHLAAKTEVALSFDNYLEVSEVNYVGTVALAEANRKLNPNLKLFVMASTMETYGYQNPEYGAFTEDTPQYPAAPYAVAKRACELYLDYMEYAYEFPFTIIRQTNAYGRTDNDFFVVERIITQMLQSKEINLGEPDPERNFIWIDDLVGLYDAIVSNVDKSRGETFVTGPDAAISIEKLVRLCAKALDWQGDVNWYTIPKRPGEIYYLNSNPGKASRTLGWEPKVSLEEGIQRTVDIWKKNYNL